MADNLQKQRGLWLENFLNPATQVDNFYGGSGKVPGFRSLARDALDILRITEKYNLENDPGLLVRERIEKAPSDVKKFYDRLPAFIRAILDGTDPLELRTAVFEKNPIFKEKFKKFYTSTAEYKGMVIDEIDQAICDLPSHQKILGGLFEKITKTGLPWKTTLFDLKLWTPEGMAENLSLYKLLGQYGAFSDKIGFDDEAGQAVFGRVFDKSNFVQRFPWGIASTNIALDFLRYGGAFMRSKGFLFCEHCGRFKFIERLNHNGKFKNQYCCDLCRTKANNLRRSQSPSERRTANK